MITVSDDYLASVKAEMKQFSQKLSDEIKHLKKTHKKVSKDIQAKIDHLAHTAEFYKQSKVIPVKVEGVVINYKLYAAFMKKIKDFHTNIIALSDGIVIQYWKNGSVRNGGSLKLFSLNTYFEDFNHVPVGVIDGSQT